MRETVTRGKGCARIDNLDTVIEGLGKGRQWNSDMASAYNNQSWWQRKALDKNIISFRAGGALDSIGMGICFTMPDSMVSVFNDPGIKSCIFFFQAEDGIRDLTVTGVQTCALPI